MGGVIFPLPLYAPMQDRDNCMCTITTVSLSVRLLLLPACQIVTRSKDDVTTRCWLSNYRHLSASRWSSNICTWNIVVYVPKTCPVGHSLSKGCNNAVPRDNVANGCYYLWYLARVTSGGQFRKQLRGRCLYWFKYGVDIHTNTHTHTRTRTHTHTHTQTHAHAHTHARRCCSDHHACYPVAVHFYSQGFGRTLCSFYPIFWIINFTKKG